MKYLEKNIFELLPDITKIYTKKEKINDYELFKLFHLEPIEIKAILGYHKKNYLPCVELSTQKKAPPHKLLKKVETKKNFKLKPKFCSTFPKS